MRIRSDIWVSAYLRRLSAMSLSAYLVRRGHEAAGEIFVVVDTLSNQLELFGPAPSAGDGHEIAVGRQFVSLISGSREKVERRLDQEKKFDPDIWVIEIENTDGDPLFND